MTRPNRNSRASTRGTIRKSREILVVTEGKETEVLYFKGFHAPERRINVVVQEGKTQDPLDLVKEAIRESKRMRLDLGTREGDAAWVVYDVDYNSDQRLREAKKLADDHNIQIAISNPCIEYWFLLHFADIRRHFENGEAVTKALKHKDCLPNYRKNSNIYPILTGEKQQEAIHRARRVNDHHMREENDLYSRASNPSTQVFAFIESIR